MCTGSFAQISELQYVRALATRAEGQCCGPLIALRVANYRLGVLEESFHSGLAHDLLWTGFQPGELMIFELCAAHWMDLISLSVLRSHQFGRQDWFGEASTLLQDACQVAGWDMKEISNMVQWQRVLSP